MEGTAVIEPYLLTSTHNSPPAEATKEREGVGGHPHTPGKGRPPSALPLYEWILAI